MLLKKKILLSEVGRKIMEFGPEYRLMLFFIIHDKKRSML
jgi:hypothetical protein